MDAVCRRNLHIKIKPCNSGWKINRSTKLTIIVVVWRILNAEKWTLFFSIRENSCFSLLKLRTFLEFVELANIPFIGPKILNLSNSILMLMTKITNYWESTFLFVYMCTNQHKLLDYEQFSDKVKESKSDSLNRCCWTSQGIWQAKEFDIFVVDIRKLLLLGSTHSSTIALSDTYTVIIVISHFG